MRLGRGLQRRGQRDRLLERRKPPMPLLLVQPHPLEHFGVERLGGGEIKRRSPARIASRSAKPVLPDRAPPRTRTCSAHVVPPTRLKRRRAQIGRMRAIASKARLSRLKSIAHIHFRRSVPLALWSARADGLRIRFSRGHLTWPGTLPWRRRRWHQLPHPARRRESGDLGRGRGGPSNLQIQNGEPAYRSILDGAKAAFAAAGLPEIRLRRRLWLLLHGRRPLGRRPRASSSTGRGRSPRSRVYDDIDAAHAGALGGEEGAVIIAGTGSAALAIVDGQRHQCGGWGFHIGDQMSGAILGRELVRRAVEATDGLVSGSPLTDAVIAAARRQQSTR